MKVVCISGKAQHGKDTTANLLKEELESKEKRVLIAHYADLLKYLCKTYFGWNGEKDEAGREILQHVGTDVIRAQNPDYWVRFLREFLMMFEDEWDYVLIPDTRFPNEIEEMQRVIEDTIHVRVIRPNFESTLSPEQQQHISETALDDTIPDLYIHNDDDLEKLKNIVSVLVRAEAI